MFSNILTLESSPHRDNKSSLPGFYKKFQSLLGRVSGSTDNNTTYRETMLSSRESTSTADDCFITPVSSVDDLMAMSPKHSTNGRETSDVTEDLLTGSSDFSIDDITMHEIPNSDDMFLDVNSLDYLVKRAEFRRNENFIDRGKESLFVKFDPLYSKQKLDSESNHTVSSDSTEHDIGYETGSAMSVFTDSVALPKHTMSACSVLSAGNKDKPLQIVPPVVNSVAPKSSVLNRTTPALVRSVSAILTPSQVATERLISINGNTPPVPAPRSPHYGYSSHRQNRLQSLKIVLEKQEREILNLGYENRALKSTIENMQHNHSREMEDLENRVKKMTDERNNLLEKENKLLQQINDKIVNNKQMCIVMEEYEKTISTLINEQQQNKKQFHEYQEYTKKLVEEKDEALAHLSNMESSFNDLLAKYEKCKGIILETKERENILQERLTEAEMGIKKYNNLYNDLKEVTTDSLNKANETLEGLKKNHSVELTKLNAAVRKHELTISSLQESLEQKTRQNEELTKICDQLINGTP